ncbi:hypothetical protein MPER_00300, partial [Moniliophthora perniciosa FA553]
MIVLNTPELADEFLVKHGRVFSDRWWPHVAADIAVRKANHSELGPIPVRQYRKYQELESRVLLHDFIEHGNESVKMMAKGPCDTSDPDFLERHWISLVRRFATSVVMNAMYGERVHAIRGNESL